MREIGSIIQSVREIIPQDMQDEVIAQLGTAETFEAAPTGAMLMGMYVLEYVGFPRYIDELQKNKHTTIRQLKDHYEDKTALKPMVPSGGIILGLLVIDMIACPQTITAAYKFEEKAKEWRTGPLLGIEPSLLNDDRIGRAVSEVGADTNTMEEILYNLLINACKKAGIPLNKLILDTTVLQLDGKFKNAPKVAPGRKMKSFAQLIVSLVIASGSRLPEGFGMLVGNTSDSSTLPDIYKKGSHVPDEGAVELLSNRIYLTLENILFLKEQEKERMVHWVSPLKMDLSQKRVRELIDEADREGKWKTASYLSTEERIAKINPPLTAFEAIWTLTEKVKLDLEPSQKKRPTGSIKTINIDVRCVFYRHMLNAKKDKKSRRILKQELEKALKDFCTKLNKRKYIEISHCQRKLSELLKNFSSIEEFVIYSFSRHKNGDIFLTWYWDEAAIEKEAKYDGIFALLTNYTTSQVNSNQLISQYCSRDEVGVVLKEMRRILDIKRVLFQRPERIDCYVFLKVIAFFVLAFLHSFDEREGIKTTTLHIN